ncbi:MAG: RNA methyltransferase [Syntrophomonas sp.]
MKNELNYGTLFRTANIYGADFLFLIGKRFKRQSSDTLRSERHIPLFEYQNFDDFNNHRPWGCPLIGVEMCQNATPLSQFKHPQRACYLLGAEDNGLTREAIERCQYLIILPGEHSLNVSVAGSIVMYDRLIKQ